MFDKLDDMLIHYEELMRMLGDPDVTQDTKRFTKLMKEQAELAPIVEAYKQYKQARLAQGARIVEVLKQGRSTPVPVEKQVAILYAVVKGVLTDVAVEDIQAYEEGLYTFLDSDAQGVAAMEGIRTTGKLEGETEEKLKAALADYTDRFLKTR